MADLGDRLEDAKDKITNKAHELKGRAEQKSDDAGRNDSDYMEDDLGEASDDW